MLDLKFIRDNISAVEEMLERRGTAFDLGTFKELDAERRRLIRETEDLRAERNRLSQEIGRAMKEKASDELIGASKARVAEISAAMKAGETRLVEIEEQHRIMVLSIPNVPHASVPVGRSETDNVEVRRWGTPRAFGFEPKPHWELGESLGIIDFENAAKLTGARFSILKGAAARLERAIIGLMLDTHTTSHGYQEMLPPFIVNDTSMTGTGQLPKFAEDLFKLENHPYYLVPTAEVPVTNYHRDDTLAEDVLPVKFAAYTPCFRAEAGSYGKDTKGLIRQHQFDKVELVKFAHPDSSFDELESLTADAERILQILELPYRVIVLCTGDMGFSSAKTYDIEVYLPSYQGYKEISSCSNFMDFQSRRMNIRFKRATGGKPEFVHTLNGSGLAVGRTLAAVLENYQLEDGSVRVPDALRPYMGGLERIA